MAGKTRSNRRAVVIRRHDDAEPGGHHGGAWKVAYADFVTAMMAFFLIMWLLNATTEAQRKGLADYFTQSNALSHSSSGTGKPFGGRTPFEDGQELSNRGAQTVIEGRAQEQPEPTDADSDSGTPSVPRQSDAEADHSRPGDDTAPGSREAGGGQATSASVVPAHADRTAQAASGAAAKRDSSATDPARLSEAILRTELDRREQAAFAKAAQAIRDAVAADPALSELARQLKIDMTPEGLRIQLLDSERRPMFATGSSAPNDQARLLLAKIAPVLAKLPERISIAGHTDAAPYRGGDRTNWDLSSERANATRRLLVESGLDEDRFRSVSGNADRDLLLPAEPLAAANRRIALVVLRAPQAGP